MHVTYISQLLLNCKQFFLSHFYQNKCIENHKNFYFPLFDIFNQFFGIRIGS